MTADELAVGVRDLGGHDLGLLLDTYRTVDPMRPTVVFAYTVKGRGLPTEGHPNNHSALLTARRWRHWPRPCGADQRSVADFDPDASAEGLVPSAGAALRRERSRQTPVRSRHPLSAATARSHLDPGGPRPPARRLAARRPPRGARVVTCSPDVASSTNLGGWINKTGVWSARERKDWFADDAERVLQWAESAHGQHIELGIAEVNLVGLLGELGATWRRWGERLIPIGTIYDPFVGGPSNRGRTASTPAGSRSWSARLGRHARARRWGSPVDHDALDRSRAARVHRLGARVRAGP